MALANKLSVEIKWENNVGIEVTAKLNSDPTFVVLRADENGEIPKLWPHYQEAIEKFINVKLHIVGQEMKQP